MAPAFLFYMFATFLVVSASGVIFLRNPIYNILCLILAFFNASGLFLLAGAEFLALILAIVYVGAVAVLFLFIVMMIDVKEEAETPIKRGYLMASVLVSGIFGGELALVAYHWWHSSKASDLIAFPISKKVSNTLALGEVIYTHYFYIFQVAGLILLVAMIGTIVLTLHFSSKRHLLKQDITSQLKRSKDNSLLIVKDGFYKGISS